MSVNNGYQTMHVHDTMHAIYCTCGWCETRRTLAISWSTRDHVLGYFDVDKARAEVQRDKNDVSGMLTGWA